MADGTDHDDEPDDDTPKLLGIIVILVLAIGGVLLIHALRRESALEDCLMSGRANCAPIEVPARRR